MGVELTSFTFQGWRFNHSAIAAYNAQEMEGYYFDVPVFRENEYTRPPYSWNDPENEYTRSPYHTC